MKQRKYVALDIGNVCIAVNKENVLKLVPQAELPRMGELVRELECGRMTEEQFLQQMAGVLKPLVLTPGEIREKYNEILCELIPGMPQLVKDLWENGFGTAFFSDISTIHLKRFREKFLPGEDLPGIYSFEAGAWKPSLQMFQAFERRYGEPLLYTDDRADLIEAAEKHGWNAVRFQSAQQIRELIFR